MFAFGLIAPLFGPVAMQTTPPQRLADFIDRNFDVSSYRFAQADLNRDHRPEALVYVTDRRYCGSGGCRLIVLTPERNSYRTVAYTTVTRPPIWLLSTLSHGWRDLGVTVQGGGIVAPYVARLRFDGRRYPGNPSVPPAYPADPPYGRMIMGV